MRNKGTQREILRKRPKNNNKAGIKLSEAISSIWEIAGKNLSVPHSQQDWWKPVPSHQGHIQPATWLTGKFPRLTLLANLGVVIGQISALQWGQWWEGLIENWVWRKGKIHLFSGGGEKTFLANRTYTYTSYSRQQITSSTLNCLFPSNTLLKVSLFFPILPASKNLPEEQTFWGTDPLFALGGRQEWSWNLVRMSRWWLIAAISFWLCSGHLYCYSKHKLSTLIIANVAGLSRFVTLTFWLALIQNIIH